jgi:hypothetical protein
MNIRRWPFCSAIAMLLVVSLAAGAATQQPEKDKKVPEPPKKEAKVHKPEAKRDKKNPTSKPADASIADPKKKPTTRLAGVAPLQQASALQSQKKEAKADTPEAKSARKNPTSKPADASIADPKKKSTTSLAGVAPLQQAYMLLHQADHDYDGHRVKAMHAIEAACKLLHVSENGDGRGGEAQGVSDQQLRQAKGLLKGARATFAQQKRHKVVTHIDNAMKQITTALNIR